MIFPEPGWRIPSEAVEFDVAVEAAAVVELPQLVSVVPVLTVPTAAAI